VCVCVCLFIECAGVAVRQTVSAYRKQTEHTQSANLTRTHRHCRSRHSLLFAHTHTVTVEADTVCLSQTDGTHAVGQSHTLTPSLQTEQTQSASRTHTHRHCRRNRHSLPVAHTHTVTAEADKVCQSQTTDGILCERESVCVRARARERERTKERESVCVRAFVKCAGVAVRQRHDSSISVPLHPRICVMSHFYVCHVIGQAEILMCDMAHMKG